MCGGAAQPRKIGQTEGHAAELTQASFLANQALRSLTLEAADCVHKQVVFLLWTSKDTPFYPLPSRIKPYHISQCVAVLDWIDANLRPRQRAWLVRYICVDAERLPADLAESRQCLEKSFANLSSFSAM